MLLSSLSKRLELRIVRHSVRSEDQTFQVMKAATVFTFETSGTAYRTTQRQVRGPDLPSYEGSYCLHFRNVGNCVSYVTASGQRTRPSKLILKCKVPSRVGKKINTIRLCQCMKRLPLDTMALPVTLWIPVEERGLAAIPYIQIDFRDISHYFQTNSDMAYTSNLVRIASYHSQPCPLTPLMPNDTYRGRTAPLTSKRCILYIYSTNIGTEYFKQGINSPFFSLQNAVCFIILRHLVLVLFTFYIHGVLKLKNNSGSKRLRNVARGSQKCKMVGPRAGETRIKLCVDKKNQLDVTFCILYFSSNSCSTCFGQPCAHHQELTTA